MMVMTSFLESKPPNFVQLQFSLHCYEQLADPTYIKIFFRSLSYAAGSTLICLIIGYPTAYYIAQIRNSQWLIFLIILPFWISSLVRSYSIIALLKTRGIINTSLMSMGITDQPIDMMYTQFAVFMGLIYNLIPFMILPIYMSMEKMNTKLIEAAYDLGASWRMMFWKIYGPLTIPGVVSGVILVFLPSMSLFYIPNLLGGARSMLLGNLIQTEFLFSRNWPMGAMLSVVLMLFMIILLWMYRRLSSFHHLKDSHAL